MVVAQSNGVPGIEAECGGSMSCGTCHVYVDPADVEKVPPASDQELEMLDLVAADQKPNSRLSCQIVLSDDLDGLVIHVPETQY
jgi:2Fe-2S ferredoxin